MKTPISNFILIAASQDQVLDPEAYGLLGQAASLSSTKLLGCSDYFQIPVYGTDKELVEQLVSMGFMEKAYDIPSDGKPYDLYTHKGVQAHSVYQITEMGKRFVKFTSLITAKEKSYDDSPNNQYPEGDWRRGHPGYE